MPTASHSRPPSRPRPLPTPEQRAEGLAALPQPLTSFVGREREIADCLQLLRRSDVRLVTLTGPGGVGKTRLAIQLAWELVDAFETVWFVELGAIRDPDLIYPTIAQALNVREPGSQSLFERLIAFLSYGPALLILDNFEQIFVAAPRLTDLLARCHELKMLVTSREVLHLTGEYDYPVPTLTVPARPGFVPLNEIAKTEAVNLFVQRALAANPRFELTSTNATAVVEICARLDGLPLAIELAAAQSRMLSPAALSLRLTNRLALLTGGPRDQPQRLQAMRDAIAWSYELLDPAEERLFRRLAVFAGGFTLEAIAAVAVVGDSTHLLEQVSALADKSLIVHEPGLDGEPRFRLLETIRAFGLERLAASEDADEVWANHARYYLEMAEQAELRLITVGSANWVERLARERANVRQAVHWALDHDQAETVLRLAGTILTYAYARGEPAEGLSWLEAALAKRRNAAPEVQVDALFTASALAQVQGDFARSIVYSDEALAIARTAGYHFGEARAHLGSGITAEWQGDFDRAASHYDAALVLMRELGDTERLPHWTVLPLANLGDLALLRGDSTRAIALAGEAVERWRGVGYIWGIAQALGTVAAATSERGDQVGAAALYNETLNYWLDCDDGRGIAGTIAGIAGVARAHGQLERAARLLGAAWGLGDRLGVRFLAHHLFAERVLASVRSRLDSATFTTAWEAGHALTLGQAVEEARAALSLPGALTRAGDGLTPRERDVLRHLVAGHSDREIAAALSISPRTVQTHVAGLFAKLNANSRAEASAIAVRRGLV